MSHAVTTGYRNTFDMPKSDVDQKELVIRRGRVDSLDIYEVKENELLTLERGSTRGEVFNFAVALVSAGLTLLVALLTAKFPTDLATAVAVAVTLALLVLGLFFAISWYRTKDEAREVLNEIRSRVPHEVSASTVSGRLPPGLNEAESS